MKTASKTCLVLALAAFASFVPVTAFARHGRGADDVVAPSTSPAAGASLAIRVRSQSHGRWEFRMTIENAAAGLAPEVFVADATGALVSAGAMTPDNQNAGEYRLRLRSAKGGTLPAGAATIDELGGRAYEVRDGGVAIFSGLLPVIGTKSSNSAGATGSGGTDDPATHDAGGDNGGTSGRGGSGGHGADDAAGHR
jgi:hypothetical protein